MGPSRTPLCLALLLAACAQAPVAGGPGAAPFTAEDLDLACAQLPPDPWVVLHEEPWMEGPRLLREEALVRAIEGLPAYRGVQGRAEVSCVVRADGTLRLCEVERALDPVDGELVRRLHWAQALPAVACGRRVSVRHTFAFEFKRVRSPQRSSWEPPPRARGNSPIVRSHP